MNNGQQSLAAGCKDQAGSGIEAIAIGISADCRGGHDFASVHIHHRDHLAASSEQTTVLGIRGKSGWPLAGSKRPSSLYGKGLGIELNDGTLVFDVNEHIALAIEG